MLNPGDRFGDYTVVRLLGQGGMGAVYLLQDAAGAQVAAKILDPATGGDHESRRRFLREAQLALGVKHPNLVQTYDIGEDPDTGLCYILMEYVPGGSLADRILSRGALSVGESLKIVGELAKALVLVKRLRIVHRDIKPENVLFGLDGTVKLTDLGIARREGTIGQSTVTRADMMIGTPAYMAPEQMSDARSVDFRADIYSLGVVLFAMLTAELPDKEDSVMQRLAKAMNGVPIQDVRTLRKDVPAPVAELISWMCANRPEDRPASPQQVADAVVRIAAGQKASIPRRRRRGRGRSVVLAGTAGLGLAVAAAAVLFIRSGTTRVSEVAPPVASTRPIVRSLPPDEPKGLSDGDVSVTASVRGEAAETREVTNVVRRVVVVTNVVTQAENPPETPPPAVAESGEAEPAPAPQMMTNVVEGVLICYPSDLSPDGVRALADMIGTAADVVRASYGLSDGQRVQSRVRTVDVVPGDGRYVYDRSRKSIRVGIGYGGFPSNRVQMARMCTGFMAVRKEGTPYGVDTVADAYVRLVVAAALDPDGESLWSAASAHREMLPLHIVHTKHRNVLSEYFRLRRKFADKLHYPMSVHDFAALVSRACGENVFPLFRKHGLKVDEFATNVKVRGLPAGAFFGL